MKYNELQVSKNKSAKRVGRGIAAGQGKTAGRGTKGQMSRTGSSKRPGFEGGQNPLMQRLPKLPGFRSFKPVVETVYTGELDQFSGKTVDTAALAEKHLISSPYVRVKLLVKGDVTKKVTVKLQAASSAAVAAVEKAGGSFEKVAQTGRTTTKTEKVSRAAKKQKA
ncbi:MAG TPA: 50S ribosomal protein L15 [Candidatus Saccharimonadales bacterium]|nr:50S ribosomal protein L15 [Candidatus Saccharimonadales bacterium]